jgi:hypothetical protein
VTVKNTQRGKRYKDWLFVRTQVSCDPPLDVIQGGASLIMRDVVRDFLRREQPFRHTTSLDAPLAIGEGARVTLLDMLAAELDPVSQLCLHEYEALADGHAGDILSDLTVRERIALLAKELRISLAHPFVEEMAGCKKSVLNDAYRGFLVRIASRLRARYPDDGAESVLTLTLMTLRRVSEEVVRTARSENPFAPLFMLAERCHETACTGTSARA